jgi:SpoVK/Ycf46/Vps4 family AAA+-type ATPase
MPTTTPEVPKYMFSLKQSLATTCAVKSGVCAALLSKYLESVLHLSRNWGCVVLLDEADVFLEQRTLNDLERNALVSVFLRVLEYYEGILILTSNRVGTFDEAFKSRIQLSLHYENLSKGQRSRIWKNFFNRLKDIDKPLETKAFKAGTGESREVEPIGIDFEDIDCYLSELAEYEMNGRQIRNAITTARQLAKFKQVLMNFSHLKHVIKVSSKFDSYLNSLREGLSDDQVARDVGIR